MAGNGRWQFGGDNGPATAPTERSPASPSIRRQPLYPDNGNRRIRKVSDGVITTVAGNGTYGFSGDNGGHTAQLSFPVGVAVDLPATLRRRSVNNRIRKVSNGVIKPWGKRDGGFSGDNGPAASAQLNDPYGVAVDRAGNVYIADTSNSRIRLLTPSGVALIYPGGIVNAASSAAGSPVAPGSIATVYGSFQLTSLSTAPSAPLPVALAGLSLEAARAPPPICNWRKFRCPCFLWRCRNSPGHHRPPAARSQIPARVWAVS